MPRTITAKVDAATQGPVTRPRRLVEVAFPSGTLRLCTGATVNWSGLTWNASGVEVGNIQAERSGAERASVALPNADRSASALVLAGPVHDSRVRVWALYGDPPYAEADPVLIFDGFVAEVPEIADLQVRLECASEHATQGEAGVPVTPHILEEALSADLVIRWGDVELTLEAPPVMASYPTVPFSDAESSRTHVPRRRVLTTRSNRARAQEYGDAELYRFVLTHDLITAGERDAIVDHYEAHLASEFALTHWRDNVTYNVIYDEAGIQVDHVAGQWWRVQVHLIGRRAP